MDSGDLLIDAFGRIEGWVHAVLAGLPAEGINFRPDAEANSIGWLIWHLTRIQDDHVAHLANRPQAYVVDGWAERLGLEPDEYDLGFGHTSDQVAAVVFDSGDTLRSYFDAVHARTIEYLDGVDAAELDQVVDTRWDPPVTAGVRIVSVMDDSMNHTGQAHYVRGLWERGIQPTRSTSS